MSQKSGEKSDDDCYFYYYSTCTKGDDCPYRHCQLALGSEVTCTHWSNGKCLRPSVCKYRHMESRINRSSIQCWFETQPMGCRKPHCVFLHKKPRTLTLDEEQTTSEGIILPVVALNQTNLSVDNNDNINNNCENSLNANNSLICNTNATNNGINGVKKVEDCSKMKLFDDSDYLSPSLSAFNDSSTNHNINIEPISISLNDCDEESDNESDKQITETQELKANDYNLNKNFGIKTLEQIRMEKVFNNESEESIINDNQCFDENDLQSKPQKQLKSTKDLRVKIKRQKESMPSVSNFSSDSALNSSDNSSDFSVKTLDQIRREREELAKKAETIAEHMNGLKENQEPRGQKRSASDTNPPVVKIKRTGPTPITSLRVQQKSENKDNCSQNNAINCDQSLVTTETNDLNVVSSTNTNHKLRIRSIDTDLDDFDFLDGDSTHNMDSNDAIDDEDDELMREINQVINS